MRPNLGDKLLEVYSLQILNTYNANPVNLYGTIVADSCMGPYCSYYYNRDRNNTQKIRPNEFLTLTSPTIAKTAYDSFAIEFNLMDDDSPSPDKAVIKRMLYWNSFVEYNEYDKVLSQVVKGRYASAVLEYAVFTHAVVANVEVMFTGDGVENCASVYGKIHALNTKVSTPIPLFEENKDNSVDVRRQQKIPLSRSRVIVDCQSLLKIEIDLWDLDSDDMIVHGLAVFEPQYRGVFTRSTKTKYGQFAVEVTW